MISRSKRFNVQESGLPRCLESCDPPICYLYSLRHRVSRFSRFAGVFTLSATRPGGCGHPRAGLGGGEFDEVTCSGEGIATHCGAIALRPHGWGSASHSKMLGGSWRQFSLSVKAWGKEGCEHELPILKQISGVEAFRFSETGLFSWLPRSTRGLQSPPQREFAKRPLFSKAPPTD